jgi:hypothetical protein
VKVQTKGLLDVLPAEHEVNLSLGLALSSPFVYIIISINVKRIVIRMAKADVVCCAQIDCGPMHRN